MVFPIKIKCNDKSYENLANSYISFSKTIKIFVFDCTRNNSFDKLKGVNKQRQLWCRNLEQKTYKGMRSSIL